MYQTWKRTLGKKCAWRLFTNGQIYYLEVKSGNWKSRTGRREIEAIMADEEIMDKAESDEVSFNIDH